MKIKKILSEKIYSLELDEQVDSLQRKCSL